MNISEHSEDPLALLAHTQQQLLGELDLCATHLPFIGGALGLFGYDLGRRFERLPVQAAADIAVPDMAVGIYDWALLRNVATGDWQLAHWGMKRDWPTGWPGLNSSRPNRPPLLPCRGRGRAI